MCSNKPFPDLGLSRNRFFEETSFTWSTWIKLSSSQKTIRRYSPPGLPCTAMFVYNSWIKERTSREKASSRSVESLIIILVFPWNPSSLRKESPCSPTTHSPERLMLSVCADFVFPSFIKSTTSRTASRVSTTRALTPLISFSSKVLVFSASKITLSSKIAMYARLPATESCILLATAFSFRRYSTCWLNSSYLSLFCLNCAASSFHASIFPMKYAKNMTRINMKYSLTATPSASKRHIRTNATAEG